MLRIPTARPVDSPASASRANSLRVVMLLGLSTLVGLLATTGVVAHSTAPPPGPITGQWINVTDTEACQPTATRVCAEFIDDEENSPYTGMFCCLERSEVPLGLFSSCKQVFRNPPREGESDYFAWRRLIDE